MRRAAVAEVQRAVGAAEARAQEAVAAERAKVEVLLREVGRRDPAEARTDPQQVRARAMARAVGFGGQEARGPRHTDSASGRLVGVLGDSVGDQSEIHAVASHLVLSRLPPCPDRRAWTRPVAVRAGISVTAGGITHTCVGVPPSPPPVAAHLAV